MMKIDNSALDKLAKILFFVVLRFLIAGTTIMFLWNWLLPGLVNAAPVNFIQAVGLMILGRLLTGNLRIGFGLSTFRKKNDTDREDFFDDSDVDNSDLNQKSNLRDDLRKRCKNFGQKNHVE